MKKILLAGGTGLIGSELIKILDKDKWEIHILSRSKKQNQNGIIYHQWDTNNKTIDDQALDVDCIINLAGAGIADKRWTENRKKVLIDSRVQAANTIKEALQKRPIHKRPTHYISASAIGYYGDSGDQLVHEDNAPVDDGFLSVCTQQWEQAASELSSLVSHFSIVRIGIVLSKNGGAFEKMLMPFTFRLASYFGNGQMKYSWIHISDCARIFAHIVEQQLEGIYNAVAPEVVTNKDLTIRMKNHMNGFYLLNPVPSFALRMAMGEMADVVLTSNNVSSKKIQEENFTFEYPSVDTALKDLLA